MGSTQFSTFHFQFHILHLLPLYHPPKTPIRQLKTGMRQFCCLKIPAFQFLTALLIFLKKKKMKRLSFLAATIMTICLLVAACSSDDGNGANSGLKITSFSPIDGPIGTTVWITGKNFGSSPSVKIGNAIMAIDGSTSETEIFAIVPDGATTGKISVTASGETYTGGEFEVTEDEESSFPTIERFTKVNTENNGSANLRPTDLVAILGSGFELEGDYTVTFSGDVVGTIIEVSETYIRVLIPEGAISGEIRLESQGITKIIGDLEIFPNPTTYVVGYVSDGQNDVPKLWIDGIPQDLENSSSANAIYVDGETIYVAGKSTEDKATVWIDGVPQYLTNGSSYAEANSIIVENGSYYVSGTVGVGENNISKAMVWQDGEVLFELTDGSPPAEANSTTVSEGVVYSVGYEYDQDNNKDIPRIWINNEAFNLNGLSSNTGGRAYDLAIGSNDVISVVGNQEFDNVDRAVLWRYGSSATFLGTSEVLNSYKYSIFLEDMDTFSFYIAGSEETENGTYKARVWGSSSEFPKPEDSEAEAFDVFVYDSDVYTVGYEDNIAKVWRNGETRIDLNDGNNNFGRAYSIFVKQK